MAAKTKNASLLQLASFDKPVGFQRRKLGWPLVCIEYFLYILILFLTLSHVVEGVDESNDILVALDEVTTVTHSSKDVTDHSVTTGAETVKRLWGVADTVAIVGKLFQYHIPNDAFAGDVQNYELTTAGNTFLPKWLYFNSTTSMLEGVPTESDIGQQYISIKAFGPEDHSGHDKSFAKDIFSIDVMAANHQTSQAIPLKSLSEGAPQQCASGQPITKMTLAIDVNLSSLTPQERIQLLQSASNYLGLNKGMLQLLPRKKENYFDLTALFAGPGNVRQLKTSGSILQWQVGCGGKINPVQRKFLNQVEYSSHNGTLADILRVPIIGWHISVHMGVSPRRVRRQLPLLYSTPVPDLVPTHAAGFPNFDWDSRPNGDVYNFDDYGEAQPDSRIVPSMSSPTYTETHYNYENPNPYNPAHTAHHRTKSKGRHHHPTHHFIASPVYRPHAVAREGNMYGGTIVPTPEVFPIRPTATLEEPSRTYVEEITTGFPFPSVDPHRPSIISSPISPVFTEPLPTLSTLHSIHPVTTDASITTPTRPRFEGTNKKPRLKNRIQKFGIIAGKVFQFVIPENTFIDAEDGSTKNLNLALYAQNASSLSSTSWVQFDNQKQMIYGLPLFGDIGEWKLPLSATDSHGVSANETVHITVQQHQMERKVNHEIVFTVDYDKHTLRTLPDRNIKLVEKIRRLFRERVPVEDSDVTVIRATPEYFIWSNDSITTEDCRDDMLKYVKTAMIHQKAHVTSHFREILQPEFRNLKVEVKWINYCKERPPVDPSVTVTSNRVPTVRNQIDNLTATVGVFLRYQIPDDVFYDHEQGTTQYLRLTLLNNTNEELRPESWIRYDSTLNALVGLPLEADEGTHTLKLIAHDRERAAASETFVIIVQRQPDHEKPSIEFSIVLQTDYKHFINDLSNKIKVLDKLAHLYGDPDPKYVTVLGIAPGSVIFNWTNNTLPVKRCAKDEIDNLVKFLFDANGTVSTNLTNAFLPEFRISKANLNPGWVCQKDITPTSVSIIPVVTTIISTIEKTEQATSDDDIFISTVIPAIVIGIMLLLAAIVACILYRKKRKGKMSVEDNDTFVNKGIPVIFADELEDRPDPAKAPMIMKEEKPPLPPPEYPRMTPGGSSPSTPPMERKDHPGHHVRASPHHQSPRQHQHHGSYPPPATLEHSESSPLYQPPPPFTTYRDSRMNRPKNTPTYRMPPPYVPP